VLLLIQVLNVYKPRGMTPYGRRKQQEERQGMPSIPATAYAGDDTGSTSRWVKVLAIIVITLSLLFVILHFTGGGLGGMHRRHHTGSRRTLG
jgi:hypothetical protein